MPTRLVALGAITKPHGLSGEVRVHRFNPDSELLMGLERVWLRKDGEVRPHVVARSRRNGVLVLLTLEGVQGRDAAEALRGWEVCVPREALPPPDEEEYYHIDLIGLQAVSPEAEALGSISEVIRYPGSDCLVVTSSEGRREVPLLAPYVVDVDIEGGKIVLAYLEDFEVRRSTS